MSKDDLVGEAKRELSAKRSTRYRHRTTVDEPTGRFEFDCSGFVVYALSRVRADALAAIPPGPRGRARAEDFVRYFEGLAPSEASWSAVRRGVDVAPGDVLAWRKPKEIESTNTGHVVIVLERVGLGAASSAVATIGGVHEYLLRVVDSTESPHADDTRLDDETGLGAGIIGLVTDAADAPIAYRWRGGLSPRAFVTTIAIGRVRAAP